MSTDTGFAPSLQPLPPRGGWLVAQEYLLRFLQEHRGRRWRRMAAEQAAAPGESEDGVNLLMIFAVYVSRQMKLINRGRNVMLSKVLTSKSKYLHRCAGSCLLLGMATCLDQSVCVVPPPPPIAWTPSRSPGKLRARAGVQRWGWGEKGGVQPGCPEGVMLAGAWVICAGGMSSTDQF